MVGCVIVLDNNIISEGFTSKYGGNHAEVNAINSVSDKSLLSKATLYVTLEPCSHFGKTPPCSNLIIEHKIPNVVIGCIDDNPEVAGKGIKKLRDSGCQVTVGILEDECKQHHKRFFTFHNKKRPYIILKWAETTDGYIAPEHRNETRPVWITNEISRQLVHKWRTEEQAILVGTNTVLQDNPSLTVRHWTGQNPIRVVLDRALKLSKNLNVFNNEAETLVISEKLEAGSTKHEDSCHSERSEESQILKNKNWNLEFINWNLNNSIAQQICTILYNQNINSIIIEGGAKTLQTFIDENLWDEARVFTGKMEFKKGVKAPHFSRKQISEEKIIDDVLKIYNNN